MARHGSRSSRKIIAGVGAKVRKREAFGEGIASSKVVDPAEAIRLAVVAWMDETVHNHQIEEANREAWVKAIRQVEAYRQQRMDEFRHRRKQNKKHVIASRRSILKIASKAPTRPVGGCKPTGLRIHAPGGVKLVEGKEQRVLPSKAETEFCETLRKSITEVRARVSERDAKFAAEHPSSDALNQIFSEKSAEK